MGHNEDFNANDSHKEPRGLTSARARRRERARSPGGCTATAAARRSSTRCAGRSTPAAGYGERNGWALPGFPEDHWQHVTPAARRADAGRRVVPHDVRSPPAEGPGHRDRRCASPTTPPGTTAHRSSSTAGCSAATSTTSGRSTSFRCPQGSCARTAPNTIALAVVERRTRPADSARSSSSRYYSVAGGVEVADVRSPGYDRKRDAERRRRRAAARLARRTASRRRRR